MMTLRGMLRRHRPRVSLCRRASDPLRKCPPAAPTRFRWPSERSAAEADASFRALRAKFPNQLGGREPIVRRTDSLCVNGKGGWNVPHTEGCRRQLPHSTKLRARSDHRRGACWCRPSSLLDPSTMNGLLTLWSLMLSVDQWSPRFSWSPHASDSTDVDGIRPRRRLSYEMCSSS